MTTTEKQKQASRENGLLGGVKTAEGKTASSMNALKHGILSFAATKYDLIDAKEIYRELAEEFGTETTSRSILVEQLALTVLRLGRCARAEAEILKEGLHPRVVVERELFAMETTETTVVSEGEVATLANDYLERLAVIHERYEPRLVSRMLKLLEALKK